MQLQQAITPCLWFDAQAEEAATLYTGIFPNSRLGKVTRYGKAGHQNHGCKPGSAMTVAFELNGQPFVALNGGPVFKFNEAISLQVHCQTQDEVDYFWRKLSAGGDPSAQRCGWLKDQFGLSWQVVPTVLFQLISDPDPAKAQRATEAMLTMGRIDIEQLKRAHAG